MHGTQRERKRDPHLAANSSYRLPLVLKSPVPRVRLDQTGLQGARIRARADSPGAGAGLGIRELPAQPLELVFQRLALEGAVVHLSEQGARACLGRR